MADERSLHIDTDWKKQAQEEKRKLAEEQQRQAQAAAAKAEAPAALAPGMGGHGMGAAGMAAAEAQAGAGRGQARTAFGALVQSIVTQALFYMGEIAPQGSAPVLNLDLAKHHVDTLAVLEEKTVNNLTEEEQRVLDGALYEARTRYVAVASQYI